MIQYSYSSNVYKLMVHGGAIPIDAYRKYILYKMNIVSVVHKFVVQSLDSINKTSSKSIFKSLSVKIKVLVTFCVNRLRYHPIFPCGICIQVGLSGLLHPYNNIGLVKIFFLTLMTYDTSQKYNTACEPNSLQHRVIKSIYGSLISQGDVRENPGSFVFQSLEINFSSISKIISFYSI